LRDALRLRKAPEREDDVDQATDFLVECGALTAVLDDRPDAIWESETQFKGWGPSDILEAGRGSSADRSRRLPGGDGSVTKGMVQTDLRSVENQAIADRGRDPLTPLAGALP